MSLSLALNTALTGLNVNQASLAVISNNIANANTEGYSRQNVDQSALILDGRGVGVRIDSISRKIDIYLERSIQRETSNVSINEEIADYYQRMQILLGEPGANNSIDEYIESYFNALQALAETPDRVSFKAAAADTAEVLARELSGLARSLEDLRFQADQDIAASISEINVELTKLDSLNVAINRAASLNTGTASLLDKRDLALEKLASFMDIEIYYEQTGAVNVFTANGIALVDDNIHRLDYRPAAGINSFINNDAMNPIQVLTLDDDGVTEIRDRDNLTTRAVEGAVTSRLESGSLEGLRQLRDDLIPDLLAQLDTLAAGLRDAVNAVHNDGSGFPPADVLTGTRLVRADEAFDWTGISQITVLNSDGTPAPSIYPDENHTGYRPLNLDFDFLDAGTGGGAGITDVQTIIDEINNHFNAPPVKATMGNLNNIQLVSNNDNVLQPPGTFTFDLDLENIANFGSDFWATDVSIADDTGAVIATNAGGQITDTVPRVDIVSYNVRAGVNAFDVNTATGHGLTVGDRVYLEDPGGGPYAGLASNQLAGFYTVTSVNNANSFTVALPNTVTPPGPDAIGVAPATPVDMLPPYKELEAGQKARTRNEGTITADLTANTASAYYDITVGVGVFDENPDLAGQFPAGTVTFRVFNNATNKLNDRYDVTATTGGAQRVFPGTPHQYIIARLVDENGNELPNINGSYGSASGYLQLIANDLGGQDFAISINEGNSQQQGQLSLPAQPIPGTNRGFSHYFELNNMFVSNNPNATGDAVDGSAINFAVEQRILDNPSLISTGEVERSNQPADPNAPRRYTFERTIGNNSVAQRLAQVSFTQISFGAAGGLPDSTQTLNGYVGEFLGFIATRTITAESNFADSETLLNGLVQRADSISGVNLDEELANTTIYQNAYVASTRVISVTDELFAELLATFQ